jgi:hypothetical protein
MPMRMSGQIQRFELIPDRLQSPPPINLKRLVLAMLTI